MGKSYIVEERDGRRVRVYESGAVLDDSNGKLIKPPDSVLINPESSIALHRAKLNKKRAVAMAAANQALEDGRFQSAWGDMGFVAAIIEAATRKALSSKDPKSIEAARFVFSETGFSDSDPDNGAGGGPGGNVPARIILLLAEIARRRDSESDPGTVRGPVIDV